MKKLYTAVLAGFCAFSAQSQVLTPFETNIEYQALTNYGLADHEVVLRINEQSGSPDTLSILKVNVDGNGRYQAGQEFILPNDTVKWWVSTTSTKNNVYLSAPGDPDDTTQLHVLEFNLSNQVLRVRRETDTSNSGPPAFMANSEQRMYYGGNGLDSLELLTIDANGNLTKGNTLIYSYSQGTLTQMRLKAAGGNILSRSTYSYDSNGHMDSIKVVNPATGNLSAITLLETNASGEVRTMNFKTVDPASGTINDLREVQFRMNSEVNLEEYQTSRLSFFPNPAKDQVTIPVEGDAQVEILNMAGMLILEGSLSEEKQVLNIESLPRGAYLIRLKTEGNISTGRLLKD